MDKAFIKVTFTPSVILLPISSSYFLFSLLLTTYSLFPVLNFSWFQFPSYVADPDTDPRFFVTENSKSYQLEEKKSQFF
jgi:hypothetical protein